MRLKMNFEEKLIKLRKEKALSQEELGEKLNVTRQTISKWELGQSKPDMDKLLEMSKLFNVSVDDLTSSENKVDTQNKVEKNENKEGKEPRKWLQILLIIAALIIIVVLVDKFIADKKAKKGEISSTENNVSTGFSKIFDSFSDKFEDMTSNLENNKKSFNFLLESYSGTKMSAAVGYLLDDIVTSNKTNSEHIITVTYDGNTVSEESEIVAIKQSLDSAGRYEVSMGYDEEGYINNVSFYINPEYLAEKSKKEEEEKERKAKKFNSSYETFSGTKWGISCGSILDNAITNNKTNNEQVIKVKYGDTETSDPEGIVNIKQTLNNSTNKWKEFEVSLDYDENGYVYKIIIEKV